jgi:putative transposase
MRALVEREHNDISASRQCELLNLSSSTFYYKATLPKGEKLKIMEEVELIYLDFPYYGSRKMAKALQKKGFAVGRKQARSLMRLMGLEAIYRKPKRANTSNANSEHKKFPYLLKGLTIDRPNQVWCTDITYIKLKTGWTYLMAVMDWSSRKIISWGLSNTMDVSFCVEVLEEALKYGKPEIFNTDQGSQYTSSIFTDVLKREGIEISMDGKGRYLDNILIERLWRTVKYEHIFINDYETISETREGLRGFIDQYNSKRLHQALEYQTPDEVWAKCSL